MSDGYSTTLRKTLTRKPQGRGVIFLRMRVAQSVPLGGARVGQTKGKKIQTCSREGLGRNKAKKRAQSYQTAARKEAGKCGGPQSLPNEKERVLFF